jgi:hypothetical protein
MSLSLSILLARYLETVFSCIPASPKNPNLPNHFSYSYASFRPPTMADVRAMFRAERAARGTATSKPRKQTKQPPPVSLPSAGRKRKAGDESVREIIKRFKAEEKSESPERSDEDSTSMQAVAEKPTREEPAQGKSRSTDPEHIIAQVEHTTAGEAQQLQATVDKDEWAAFERDMAAFPPEPSGRSALDAIKSGGTISAAPMTADAIAAQAQEEKMRRSRREEEIADEKEDAAQALEEEFDEMEELEQRAKRLREMREKLREQQAVGNPDQQEHPEAQQDQEEDDDEGNIEDDIDDWIKFG